jgi:XTP/dITP diphosphohydrolase
VRELIFASSNKGKSAEIKKLLEGIFVIKDLGDIGYAEELPETGDTLESNALQKARYLSESLNGVDCFADDSGLVIHALNGEPGVYSARYAGPEKDPGKNMALALKKLETVNDRSASFLTVIALLLDGKETLFEGRVNGVIAEKPVGTNGFGYDPIFIPEGHDKTFAEMSSAEKNTISHRAQAVKKLVDFLSATQA